MKAFLYVIETVLSVGSKRDGSFDVLSVRHICSCCKHLNALCHEDNALLCVLKTLTAQLTSTAPCRKRLGSAIAELVLLHGNTDYSLLVDAIDALFVLRIGAACPCNRRRHTYGNCE